MRKSHGVLFRGAIRVAIAPRELARPISQPIIWQIETAADYAWRELKPEGVQCAVQSRASVSSDG